MKHSSLVSCMRKEILAILLASLAIGTAISWHRTNAESESGLSQIEWRLLYESKNERALKLVPVFLMIAFSLIAIASILACEMKPSKRFIKRPEPTKMHDFQEEGDEEETRSKEDCKA